MIEGQFAQQPRESPETLVSQFGSHRSLYDGWTLGVGALALILIISFSFMMGSRLGWLASNSAPAAPTGSTVLPQPAASAVKAAATPKPTTNAVTTNDAGGLVVYEQGKVVFRMKPSRPRSSPASREGNASSPAETARVWLAADLAESRVTHRVEPQYPPEAQASHRTGDVVIEVLVNSDGTVASASPLRGDPLLAAAAADAIRNWRYQPYSVKGRPAEFETDVTLRFSLPE